MIYTIICLIVFVLGILFLILRKNKEELPKTLFERIATAAVAIQYYFINNKYSKTKNDKSVWNNASFIIAFLLEYNLCRAVDQIYLQKGFKQVYGTEESAYCESYIKSGVSYYRSQIRDMKCGLHDLPDVIIYNLLHPDGKRKNYDDVNVVDINIITTEDCWGFILNLIEKYFVSDKKLSDLPIGC